MFLYSSGVVCVYSVRSVTCVSLGQMPRVSSIVHVSLYWSEPAILISCCFDQPDNIFYFKFRRVEQSHGVDSHHARTKFCSGSPSPENVVPCQEGGHTMAQSIQVKGLSVLVAIEWLVAIKEYNQWFIDQKYILSHMFCAQCIMSGTTPRRFVWTIQGYMLVFSFLVICA